MSVADMLENMTGEWKGENRLRLSPNEPEHISEAEANIALAANGQVVTIRYNWKHEKRPQEGMLMIGQNGQPDGVRAAWVDSWHLQDRIMHCQGFELPECGISVHGTYAAPPDRDWGWRIILVPQDEKLFDLIMYNVRPDGHEELAVEAVYRRV